MDLIRTTNVTKVYKTGKIEHPALNGIDLTISTGEFTAIAGPSGSGKTTLLNLLGCLDKPTQGDIVFKDINVNTLNPNQLSDLRNQYIGFIFQTFNLIPVLTAFENVEFPLLLRKGNTVASRKELVTTILEDVGLKDFMYKRPNEMSGGQQQRVAVARALVKKPKLILADEPTANLDSNIGNSIIENMKKLNLDYKISFIFSTHDKMVMDHATRLIIIKDGRITEDIHRNEGK